MAKPNGVAVKIAFIIAGLLVCVLGWIGTNAIDSTSKAHANTQARLSEHCEQVGHPGTISILERIEMRQERMERRQERIEDALSRREP